MLQIKSKNILEVIDWLVYLILLCLGIYFIYQGHVWDRFILKRTDFSEFGENVTELPTVISMLLTKLSNQSVKLGEDFNISYEAYHGGNGNGLISKLEKGENSLDVGFTERLKIDLELPLTSKIIKITPNNFKAGMAMDYKLTFTFRRDLDFQSIEVQTFLASENNSLPLHLVTSTLPNDGDIETLKIALGESLRYKFTPKKRIYVEILLQLPN